MMMSEESSIMANMKALILVGGYGTSLVPLTLLRPPPLVEFANKPILEHQLDALVNAGVRQIVLAVSYHSEELEQAAKAYSERAGVDIMVLHENEPLGTAGPMVLARKYLQKDLEPFFVLNSDIICDIPFKDMIAFHKSHGGEGTMAVSWSDEAWRQGKLYLFTSKLLDNYELRPTSIEKKIVPDMLTRQQLHAFKLKGYWMNVGQPKDFLTGMCLYLKSERQNSDSKLKFRAGPEIVGNVLMDESVKIGHGCLIGPNVTIGKDVVIEDGVCIKHCTVLSGSKIDSNAWLDNCIVGWKCKIGKWVKLENVSVLGEGVTVKDGVWVNGGKVVPHKAVSRCVIVPQIIM